jgi:sialic acid synthase SpsE
MKNSFINEYLNHDVDVYFIAEIGINHNGKIKLAKRMIDESRKAGASAVKFQKRNFKALLLDGIEIEEPTGYLSIDENDFPSGKKAFGTWTYPDSRLEFTDKEFLELWKYTEAKGLDFIVSPWEEKSVDFLVKHKAKVIKLASIDNSNYQFCEYIAGKGVPTIISTGMCGYDNLIMVNDIFNKAKCPMVFLHCTSAYPSKFEDKHLKCIPFMSSMFNMEVGFSGHAIGIEGAIAAIALGARIVEKHVTLNRKMSGPDHSASLHFDEFGELVEKGNNVYSALGNCHKKFLSSEKTLHSVLARKIVAVTEIKTGTKIQINMLQTYITKSPNGLLPDQIYNVVGSIATRDINKYQIMEPDFFKNG